MVFMSISVMGILEKIYEMALAHRWRRAKIADDQQRPLNVYDEDGTLLRVLQ